jgi:hypothetical protein
MSATIPDGGAAFPVPDTIYPNGQVQYGHNGMTLRDWFAGQSLQATNFEECIKLAVEVGFKPSQAGEYVAKGCYRMADAMLKARTA